jgi:hypothetical protein
MLELSGAVGLSLRLSRPDAAASVARVRASDATSTPLDAT